MTYEPFYLTAEKLRVSMGERSYLQCTDDDRDGEADAAVLAEIFERAEALGEGYAGRQLPISALRNNPPLLFVSLLLPIAKQYAYERKPELIDREKGSPCQAAYNESMKQFREIGKGELKLDHGGVPAVPVTSKGAVRTGTHCGRPVGPGFIKDGTGPGGF